MKILINTPLLHIPAGVSNHYLGLRPYFSIDVKYNQFIPIHYLKKRFKSPLLVNLIRFLLLGYDMLIFCIKLLAYRRPYVLLNTSFSERALKRDGTFLLIAKKFRCKVLVFIHGWNMTFFNEVSINNMRLGRHWNEADAFFVLGERFKKNLEKLQIQVPIFLTTTKVDDRLIEVEFGAKQLSQKVQILFLARVEKSKGILIAIDTFAILNERHQDVSILIVGDGNWLNKAREYVKERKLSNVSFAGALSVARCSEAYKSSDIYILPTTHGEGMPTTVLEAMAFGLPVITRPVGGLIDFFRNGEMGYLIDSLDPSDYANAITRIINDTSLFNSMSLNNQVYARDNFLASKVAFNMEASIKMI